MRAAEKRRKRGNPQRYNTTVGCAAHGKLAPVSRPRRTNVWLTATSPAPAQSLLTNQSVPRLSPHPVVQIGAASANCPADAVPPQAECAHSNGEKELPPMPRSRIEIYWNTADTAPDGVIAQVRVTDNSGSDYLLPYPSELTKEGWVNAASGKPLAVRVTYWKPYVETSEEEAGEADRRSGSGPTRRRSELRRTTVGFLRR